MKLLICDECADVVVLTMLAWRACRCGVNGGRYNADGDTVEVTEGARLLGMCNHLRWPERFTAAHIRGCSNAWPYPENWKVQRV